ncbi:alpha/beta hydrolase [uncultured Shewanella sp.]|uniref:alpha/beta fold hydrolase n=1 Tax=uncultured Shewanella sp. TaxID=173975 RepID=UPI00261139E2|nr:alpha/beta hydrolase [uncultured Shewanella sp.]
MKPLTILPADHGYFSTSDKVKLHYIDKGQGQPLVMLSSWTLCSRQFEYQILGLCQKYRVIALDMRGHGQSQQVDYGYKIYRFAKDLHEFFEFLSLDKITALGHSVGGSVVLCYWELFNGRRLAKLVLLDRPSLTISNPSWTPEQVKHFGAGMDENTAVEINNMIAGSGGAQYKGVLLNCMLTPPISLYSRQCLLDSSQIVPEQQSATLFYDDVHQDWRSVLKRINVPTLIIAGRASPISLSSLQWLQAQIKDAELVIFEEYEGGKHFPFLENSMKFNRVIDNFMQQALGDA